MPDHDFSLLSKTYQHRIFGVPVAGPWPEEAEEVFFGMGCFWGVERLFWQAKGVISTSVGYQGGHVGAADYRTVCTGTTGHAETVQVVYDSRETSFSHLMKLFWENHDPTQGNRQGPDQGTQYRSVIFVTNEDDIDVAEASKNHYQSILSRNGYGAITTEIRPAPTYYFAEDYHQQYLDKNPTGYCSMQGTGCLVVEKT